MKIGQRIKDRRIELGMSVEDLARKIGKNRATVYRYENSDIRNLPAGDSPEARKMSISEERCLNSV